VFDGHIDLLLILVQNKGLDLRELSLSELAGAYLEHFDGEATVDLHRASEFLLAVGTLCRMKSRELGLVPQRAEDAAGEELDPEEVRRLLADRLQRYRRLRDAANALAGLPQLNRDTFTRRQPPRRREEREVDPGIDADGLGRRYRDLLRRHAAARPTRPVDSYRSLKDLGDWLISQVETGPRDLAALLRRLDTRGDRLMAILAMIELNGRGKLTTEQSVHLGPITVAAPQPDDRIYGRPELVAGGAA